MLFDVNWAKLFLPSVPILETIVRGTLVYLILFALLRFILKREAGTIALTDLLVLVLIADAAQNAMAADYSSITDGIILVTTIICWSYILDWLGYKFPWLQHFVHPPALPLVKEGRLLLQNMRRELITKEELMSQLHHQGIADLSEVKAAYMEGDGRISVIPREPRSSGGQHERQVG